MWNHSLKTFICLGRLVKQTLEAVSFQILYLTSFKKVFHNTVMCYHPTTSKVSVENDAEKISIKTAMIMWIRKPVKFAATNNENVV